MRRVARGASADDSFDDVFESEGGRFRADDSHLTTNSYVTNVNAPARKTADDNYREKLDPSPTGYRDYTPPAEVLQNRWDASSSQRFSNDNRSPNSGYPICNVDFQKKEETFTHKTILLGDSGVGKTSLLVQFDTGQFQTGNFAATVGIGFTVMLLGDSGVGKTCLLTRFRDGRFLSGNYITTVGIDFRNKMIEVDEAKVKLQIWDTAGQERFRSVTHAYYRDAHALLLLYDVTNKTSYDNIRAWLGEIREYAHDDVVIMLLGNKCDCGNERIVKREDGERLAREHNVPFMETSAKTGLNVELAFVAVARYLKARKSGNPDTSKFNVQDYVRQQSQKKTCFNYNCSTT
ncbi:ras-related protein Rab-37-like isoform X3 [Venturia canescens]|uniref:ras-related protein Rab-37-like isoform X3 n=1 Tax=Venturia canescens TaxID=32260 RepID=UPI001C9C7024|nr:ras-related protein Rab-37-like isoform X3 [Venturia canescens]